MIYIFIITLLHIFIIYKAVSLLFDLGKIKPHNTVKYLGYIYSFFIIITCLSLVGINIIYIFTTFDIISYTLLIYNAPLIFFIIFQFFAFCSFTLSSIAYESCVNSVITSFN